MTTLAKNFEQIFEKNTGNYAVILSEAFKRITRFYVLFHLLFGLLVFTELCSFIFFFSFWIHSSTVAFLIGMFLLTGFSYFVLLSYLQTKKPQQLAELGQTFIVSCKNSLSSGDSLLLTHAIYRTLNHLDRLEAEYYVLPFLGETVNHLLKKFSVYCHWRDVHTLKELLLFKAISEHIDLVKKEPTDLETHAALADAYLKLAKLYKEPETSLPWIPPDYASVPMQTKHKRACERALEEYKIIEAYVPRDPWIHAQLANVYREIGDLEKEILEYELILSISPQDRTVMYHLGVLYFERGSTAKGLQMYENLQKIRDENAPRLIAHYGSSLREMLSNQ
jgi:tetratricopeptide (TPR) repeat protein